eukprot:6186303-Alexandrium_andersonii.AAC.1
MGLNRLQAAPQYSSASMGSVERFRASLQAQIRALFRTWKSGSATRPAPLRPSLPGQYVVLRGFVA